MTVDEARLYPASNHMGIKGKRKRNHKEKSKND
jgi:hypothetical protein